TIRAHAGAARRGGQLLPLLRRRARARVAGAPLADGLRRPPPRALLRSRREGGGVAGILGPRRHRAPRPPAADAALQRPALPALRRGRRGPSPLPARPLRAPCRPARRGRLPPGR